MPGSPLAPQCFGQTAAIDGGQDVQDHPIQTAISIQGHDRHPLEPHTRITGNLNSLKRYKTRRSDDFKIVDHRGRLDENIN